MAGDEVKILSVDGSPELPLIDGAGSARAVVWSGTGARLRAMHLIDLEPGAATVPQTHEGEAVYAILDGDGAVHDDAERTAQPVETGSMVHIDGATPYRLVAGDAGLRLVGGPAPIDAALYAGLAA
jgi:quercetin dioxygenase-like cupin family protein